MHGEHSATLDLQFLDAPPLPDAAGTSSSSEYVHNAKSTIVHRHRPAKSSSDLQPTT